MRLIEAGKGCKPGERAVTWNVQGLQGATGPQGAQGEIGPRGAPGPAGAAPITVAFNHGTSGFGIVDAWSEVMTKSFWIDTPDQSALIEYSAQAACVGGGTYCPVRILFDGFVVGSNPTFDSVHDLSKHNAVVAVAPWLTAGSHEVRVEVYTSNGTSVELTDGLLKVTRFSGP